MRISDLRAGGLVIALTVCGLLIALAAGGAVWVWQHRALDRERQKVAGLTNSLNQVRDQLDARDQALQSLTEKYYRLHSSAGTSSAGAAGSTPETGSPGQPSRLPVPPAPPAP